MIWSDGNLHCWNSNVRKNIQVTNATSTEFCFSKLFYVHQIFYKLPLLLFFIDTMDSKLLAHDGSGGDMKIIFFSGAIHCFVKIHISKNNFFCFDRFYPFLSRLPVYFNFEFSITFLHIYPPSSSWAKTL